LFSSPSTMDGDVEFFLKSIRLLENMFNGA